MFCRLAARVAGFTALAVVLLCSAVNAQDAALRNAPEPVHYAATPKFWGETERVLQSGLELYWTNSGVIGVEPGKRQEIMHEARESLARLKVVSLPQFAGFRRVRVFSMPNCPQFSLLGFLVREEPEAWTIFTSRWRVERIARAKHTRIEASDLNQEIDAALKLASIVQGNRDRVGILQIETPPALKDSYNHFNRSTLLFDIAYLAFAAGRREAVEPLLRAAFYQRAELLAHLYDDLAWRQFESAVLDLNQGARRDGLAQRFQRMAVEFPGGRYEKQATEYWRTLSQMAAEDAGRPQPRRPTTVGDRMRSLIFELRECNSVQDFQPGECRIPSVFQPVEDPRANAADLLIREGFDAVPALIESLDDSRLTRSYGFDRDFIPWRYVLQVRDAAIQSLVEIADDRLDGKLYHPNNTGQYFSNDTPEARAAAVGRVNDWWADVQAIGEAAWLRNRLERGGHSRPMLLRRLVQIERQRALPDVRKWLVEEKRDRTYAYQLLLRTGSAEAIAEVRAVAEPESTPFEFAALFALHREGQITKAEYKTALLQAARMVLKGVSDKPPVQVLSALTESGDRQCTLIVAERLRTGRLSFDRSMQWALSKINDSAIAEEVAAYLLPLFDDAEIAVESGWRNYFNGERDIYRVKDQAAFSVNRLLGEPLPAFHDLTPPERDAEIEKLRKLCTGRGIEPAFALPLVP